MLQYLPLLLYFVEPHEITVKDIMVYLGAVIIFYQFFMWLPSTWIELITAHISSDTLNLLGVPSDYGIQGRNVWLSITGGARPVNVYIIRECTAIHVWGIIIGLVAPLRTSDWLRKMKAVLFGCSFIFLMNITRIMVTVTLTGYDAPPFSWFFQNPTVSTYHYPVSFLYGVIGIALVIWLINKYFLTELGEFLEVLPDAVVHHIKKN